MLIYNKRAHNLLTHNYISHQCVIFHILVRSNTKFYYVEVLLPSYVSTNAILSCSADLPMSFEDRVSAVEIATQFQEQSNEVFKMMEEGTDSAKTQVM